MRVRALAVAAGVLVLFPAVPLGAATYVCVTSDTCVYLRGNTLQVCVQGSCLTEPIPPAVPSLPPPPGVPPLPAVPALPEPSSLLQPFIPHPPIQILNDAGFLAPTSGVINPYALGTEQDPYIIENWQISPIVVYATVFTRLGPVGDTIAIPAIQVQDTTKHVVIRDTWIHPGIQYGTLTTPASGIDLGAVITDGFGIDLQHADNVTIANSTIENLQLNWAYGGAVYVWASNDFTLTNSTIQNTNCDPVNIHYGARPTIRSTAITNSTGCRGTEGLTLEGTSDAVVHGSRIVNHRSGGILLMNSHNTTIDHDLFASGYNGIGGTVYNLSAMGNIFKGNRISMNFVIDASSVVQIHNNDVEDMIGLIGGSTGIEDAKLNWWGCAAGPNQQGCSAVWTSPEEYTPWLTAPPADAGP